MMAAEIAALTAELTCHTCGEQFRVGLLSLVDKGIRYMPTHCPACMDKRQRRPVVAVHTECVRKWPAVRIHSLPCEWTKFRAREDDLPDWKISVRGERYGAHWSGRVDMRAPHHSFHNPPTVGDVVSVWEMKGDREVMVLKYTVPTLHYGPSPRQRYLPVTATREEIAAAEAETGGNAERITETRTWLSLGSPMAEAADRVLLWLEAYSKTTLKGFGRQYAAGLHLDGAEAVWEVSGGCRSGRYGTQAALVICAPGAPISKWHREGGETTETSPWPMEQAAIDFDFGGFDFSDE